MLLTSLASRRAQNPVHCSLIYSGGTSATHEGKPLRSGIVHGPFAAAWKLSLGRKLGTHRAHLICFSEINTLSSALGTVVTHILLVI